MQTVITTVGTSLLTNADQASISKRPWAGWRFKSAYPPEAQVLEWLKSADARQASAEIHTWYRLGILDNTSDVKVVLVSSQTPDGQYCANRLEEFAEFRGIKVEKKPVEGLTYTDSETFNRGLSRLVRIIAESIRSSRREGEVVIAATGGFKAEIAIANLVGTLLGTPVYYIYEQFEQLVKIEPIPITLAPEWLREGSGQAFLRKLAEDDCLSRREVDSFLRADGKLELLIESVEDDGNEIVCPNVLGELAAQLITTPQIEWPTNCNTEPHDKIKLQVAAHHRPSGYESIVERIACSRMVTQIRYDGTAGDRKGIFPVKDNLTDIHVILKDDKAVLGLRVGTTAENIEQRRLVIDHLRQKLNL
jgi:putative CRISPR-associated protein (TIGR02619 family)